MISGLAQGEPLAAFLLLVAMPGAPSSVLVPSSDALHKVRAFIEKGHLEPSQDTFWLTSVEHHWTEHERCDYTERPAPNSTVYS